ncbi:helix-hairpin-helix domain-containing protein [Candidatus Poribacteria bacterium]|nr:helix-hairpin-helix domain-containing protein [Candidatus Poribacteria bacterium]
MWNQFTAGEKRILAALMVVTLIGAGVSLARRARPEWFYGPPDFVLDEPLNGVESEAAEEPASPVPKPPSAPTETQVAPAPSAADAVQDRATRVNLNTADSATLQTLPGIGPVLAERIIAYRKEAGGFHSVDDLIDVRGIGPKTLGKLRDLVTVEP